MLVVPPTLKIPPPLVAELPETVLLLRVKFPPLKIPPLKPPAKLPETVLLLRVKFSIFSIPPPFPEELPCVMVKPLILTTCCVLESPSLILNTRLLLFPLIVILSVSPSMVTDLLITNSVPLRIIVPLAILSAKVIVPPSAIAPNASLKLISPSAIPSSSSFRVLTFNSKFDHSNAPISAC
ncbi:hypothetical protein CWATWH0402_5823 [Crocosphaera watsonii WH 0402]|uniref:Uncharacterized protein n=2 Tax=Crocosphaera watsonii TaxID=263511 RepID=T2JW53_CROWT|nr:hypothetical protein CWATWH0005_3001 [Crocosphaera watsonii WH 0005]CCQ68842.1 hypothetical protein CWATWH0402_5823 [Crocosphaera watsonii WH 0402]